MKYRIAFVVTIVLVIFLVLVLGYLVHLGCISSSIAQYWMLGVTLVAILLYAYFTFVILQIQRLSYQLNQNPILGSYIEPQLVERDKQDGKLDYITIFHIENLSRVHAVARIDTNPKLNGKPAKTNDSYSGKKWWYIPAIKSISGNFPLVEILESHGINLGEFREKKSRLTLEIKVIFKQWDQQEDRPMLENPPDQWYYDHDKRRWVHEPTTSEIQFPMFAERNDK